MRSDERWGSHLPVLLQGVTHTSGPVLELGAGWFSTPALHVLCRGRGLMTMETDSAWLRNFEHMANPGHRLMLVEATTAGWLAAIEEAAETAGRWSLALVDNAPVEARISCARLLASFAKIVLIHDQPVIGRNMIEKIDSELAGMRYRRAFCQRRPMTAAFSNSVDFSLWEDI